jgi:hypothetical protein
MDKVTKSYLIREVTVKEIKLDPAMLTTVSDAAEELNRSIKTVSTWLDTGKLTAYEDPQTGQRFVLRSEVEELLAAQRGPKATWAPRLGLDRCKACGRSDLPHQGKGLCKNCYQRDWQRRQREARDD